MACLRSCLVACSALFAMSCSQSMSSLALAKPAEEIEVTVQSEGDIIIGGTLALPELQSDETVPLVIFISGSGQQNRDASNLIEGYAPQKQQAKFLQSAGYATFRYDERGIGNSTGDWAQMTIEDHVADVTAIISEVRDSDGIDQNNIILMGHSEGSIITSMLVEDGVSVTGVIHLAGPGWPLRKIISYQAKDMVERGDMSDEEYAEAVKASEKTFLGYIKDIPNLASSVDIDPASIAKKTNKPALIVQGAVDNQVLPEQAAELAMSMIQGGNDDVTMRILPAVNHLMTDHPSGIVDYADLPNKGVSTEVMTTIIDWLDRHYD